MCPAGMVAAPFILAAAWHNLYSLNNLMPDPQHAQGVKGIYKRYERVICAGIRPLVVRVFTSVSNTGARLKLTGIESIRLSVSLRK
jgi:hypothetical protein